MTTESENLPNINTTAHLNRAKVKRTALEIAAVTRLNGFGKPRFSRVSMSFMERIDAKVVGAIREEIRTAPSKGKTLL
jgi:hypothetical protein